MAIAILGVFALLGVGVAVRSFTSGQCTYCKDGWESGSSGRGTCSWHGGVDEQ
jgi:hypothetical protein